MDKFWKLDSPSMCRDFLKSVRIGKEGAKIEYLQAEDGTQVSIDEATDAQVLSACELLVNAMGNKPWPTQRPK